jgi:hypothetical protein
MRLSFGEYQYAGMDKENGRNPRVPAKFEQGGFTSGRRVY